MLNVRNCAVDALSQGQCSRRVARDSVASHRSVAPSRVRHRRSACYATSQRGTPGVKGGDVGPPRGGGGPNYEGMKRMSLSS